MKKLIFVAFCLAIALSSCTKSDDIMPDQSINGTGAGGRDDNGGSSSSSSSTNISLNVVPQSIKDLISANFAGWRLTEAEVEVEHGKLQYKLKLEKGGDKIRLLFDSNWKLLPGQAISGGGVDDNSNSSSSSSASSSSSSNSTNNISLNAVPQSVKDFVAQRYAGWRLKEAEFEMEHGQVQYKLKLERGKDDIRLIFDANWKFIREKN